MKNFRMRSRMLWFKEICLDVKSMEGGLMMVNFD